MVLKRRYISWWKINKLEVLFITFILFNMIKLTGVQWFITRSGYSLFFVLTKNFLFLFFIWRLIFLIKNRSVFLICFLIQTLYLGIHTTYFIYVEHILTLSQIIFSFAEGVTSIRSVFVVMNKIWFYFPLIDIVPFILLYHFYPLLREKIIIESKVHIPVIMVFLLAAFLGMGFFLEDISSLPFKTGNFKYGTIFAQISNLRLGQQDFIEKIEYGEILEIPSKKSQSNIITIQVESLNADIIGFKHNAKLVTPFLNKIAEENIYYPYLLSQHKSGGSSDAEFSIFNSVEAINGFPAANFSEYDYPNSFITRLKNYNSFSFHGNYGSFFHRDDNMENMGFSRFWDIESMNLDEIGWGASDEDVYNFMLDRMDEENGLFYYHIITMTSHGPFTNANLYYQNANYNDLDIINEKNYLNTISYVDKALEKFITQVQAKYPDTYIFIYGDHTVKIDGDSYFSKVRYREFDSLFEYVPLIIITPDKIKYRETSKVVSFLDIAPTVLSASGVGTDIRTFGESLISDDNIILENKILLNGEYYSREELYNKIVKYQLH